jgi:hypothetical protein
MTTSHELFHEVAGLGRQLRAAFPEVYAGYIQKSPAAQGEGGRPARQDRGGGRGDHGM